MHQENVIVEIAKSVRIIAIARCRMYLVMGFRLLIEKMSKKGRLATTVFCEIIA